MKNLYGVLIALGFILCSCKQKASLTPGEVIAAIERFDEGWKNKNVGVVDSILSPSYIYFTQSGGTFGRKNILETAASSDYQLQSTGRKKFDIKIEGNTAVVNTIWNGKGSYYGTPFDDTQRCSITVIKNNGKVEILSEHCTLVK